MTVQGRAWIFGDDVDTDLIVPGQYMASAVEEASKHAFEAINPSFAAEVKPNDIIVAGKNFGCGSSREIAPQVIKHLGIACVLAESYARIFFRNAIAIGLPALSIHLDHIRINPLEEISVSMESGEVVLKKSGNIIKVSPLPEKMREVIDAGGIDGMLKNLSKR